MAHSSSRRPRYPVAGQVTMRRLSDSDLELVVESGFVYVPLLFDPTVEREIRTRQTSPAFTEFAGKLFVKAVSLQSLVENYANIDPESYDRLRSTCVQKHRLGPGLTTVSVDDKLKAILFQVMPHFVRRKPSLERNRLSEEEILDLISERVTIPRRYYKRAADLLDFGRRPGGLRQSDETGARVDPPKEGPISTEDLREWIFKALETRIVEQEKARLRQVLGEGGNSSEARRKHVAILLYLADKGSLEIDSFGFSRAGMSGDYLIYKWTGEYALKDYYGRVYLFPDCRVGVSTILPLRPVVMETYKHPFLEGFDAGQPICLRGFAAPQAFSAAGVIQALEEGIHGLLYGYSSRRRNGYHSLDRASGRVRTVEVDEEITAEGGYGPVVRKRHLLDVDFDDYRLSRDHPKVASGQVEITNDYTP